MAVKNAMRDWVVAATAEELSALAFKARTTVGTLRQLAGGYRTGGKAVATSQLATNIELATKYMARTGLEPVLRGEISNACAGCDLYKKEHAKCPK